MSSLSGASSIGGSVYASYTAVWSRRSLQPGQASDMPVATVTPWRALDDDGDEEGTSSTDAGTGAAQASDGASPWIDMDGLLATIGQGDDADDGESAQAAEADGSLVSSLDGDGDGAISSAELGALVGDYGTRLATLMAQLDTDGDGSVSVQELGRALSTPSQALSPAPRTEAFVQFAVGQYQRVAGVGTAATQLLDIAA